MKRFYLRVLTMFCVLLVDPSATFAQSGKLERGTITSPALEGNLIGDSATRNFFVYLPPSYETGDKEYPVFYVLHGYTQNAGSLTNIRPIIDRMIQNGEIREMIAVFVDGWNKFGGSHFRSSITIGDYETYIVKDLVNRIEVDYRTLRQSASRGITGFSDGGDDSIYLAMKYPDIFSVVVAQGIAGNFDVLESHALATARANPANFSEFNRLSIFTRWVLSFSAVVAPNPNNPPLFLNKPAKLVNNRVQLVPEVWQKILEQDNMYALERYVAQPLRLRGIKFVNGVADAFNPVRDVREFDKKLTEAGIEHEYVEHGGGHVFLAEESLQFLSDHLAFEILPTVNVQPKGKLATTWAAVKQRQ